MRGGGEGGIFLLLLDDGVVGNVSSVCIAWRLTGEEFGTKDDHPSFDRVVLLDDPCVKERNEEDGRKKCEPTPDAHCDRSNVPVRLLGQAEPGRALVHHRERTHRTGNKEEEWGGKDGPWDWILADVHE